MGEKFCGLEIILSPSIASIFIQERTILLIVLFHYFQSSAAVFQPVHVHPTTLVGSNVGSCTTYSFPTAVEIPRPSGILACLRYCND